VSDRSRRQQNKPAAKIINKMNSFFIIILILFEVWLTVILTHLANQPIKQSSNDVSERKKALLKIKQRF
jgi:hypothetical protein